MELIAIVRVVDTSGNEKPHFYADITDWGTSTDLQKVLDDHQQELDGAARDSGRMEEVVGIIDVEDRFAAIDDEKIRDTLQDSFRALIAIDHAANAYNMQDLLVHFLLTGWTLKGGQSN